MKSVYLETYGCSANQNNSEIISKIILNSGLELTNNENIADFFILNTCIVKGKIINKMRSRINSLLRFNKPLIITGCFPGVYKLKGKNLYFLSVHQIKNTAKLIKDIGQGKETSKYLKKQHEIKLGEKQRKNKLIGIIQISEGCTGSCNFCITKKAKGELFSYPQEQIIEQAEKDLKSGVKEIWITSQDNAAYGLDRGRPELPELLNKILSLDYNFKLRLGMMNPNNVILILEKLIEIYKNKKMFQFLHVPVQSGSDKILKLMNRRYKIEDFDKIIRNFQQKIPNLTLSTDIILGYPHETQEDYEETKKLVEKYRFPVLNLSRFWPIQKTQAATEEQLDNKLKIERTIEIQKLHKAISEEDNKKLIGTDQEVLVDDKQGKVYFSRTNNYRIVVIFSEKNILGKLIKVKIKQAQAKYFVGE